MSATKWLYGDAWERFQIEAGQTWGLPNGSRVAVHNIFDELPGFMQIADLVFVDPPWNLGNLNTFYTKAGRDDYQKSFDAFADALFHAVVYISPNVCYIEIGNQMVDRWQARLQELFPVVQRWPVTYYRKHPTNLLRGAVIPVDYDYTGKDEAKCISILAQIENYTCIADPCMGRGLVGMAAYQAGKRFVGTELNKRRLAVLLDNLAKAGAEVSHIEQTEET